MVSTWGRNCCFPVAQTVHALPVKFCFTREMGLTTHLPAEMIDIN